MLGTGNALVTKCYNTCFIIENENDYFMVDAGGGNTVLNQLEKAKINWKDVKHIFVTHKHIDHLLGMIWMIRLICQNMAADKYEGEAYIYGHQEVIEMLETIARMLLQSKQTKFQEIIFTIMMVFMMVYFMICYNIALNVGSMTNQVFLDAFHKDEKYLLDHTSKKLHVINNCSLKHIFHLLYYTVHPHNKLIFFLDPIPS